MKTPKTDLFNTIEAKVNRDILTINTTKVCWKSGYNKYCVHNEYHINKSAITSTQFTSGTGYMKNFTEGDLVGVKDCDNSIIINYQDNSRLILSSSEYPDIKITELEKVFNLIRNFIRK